MEQSHDLTVKLFSSLINATKQIEPFFQSNQNQKQKQKKLNKQTQQKLVHSQKKIKVLLNKGLNWLNPIETLNLNTSLAQDLNKTKIQKKQISNKNKNNTNSSKQNNTMNSNNLNKNKKQKTRKKNLNRHRFQQLKDFSTILKLNNLIFDHVENLLGKVLAEESEDIQEKEKEKEKENEKENENETDGFKEKGKGKGRGKDKEKEVERKNDKQNRYNKKNKEQGNVVKFISNPNYDKTSFSQNQNQSQKKHQEFDTNDLFKLVKPQLRFQEQIDNSNKPFQLKLKNKPNCKLPLEQSLLKMKKDGTYNPYSYELNSLQFSSKHYHYYSTTKEILESTNIKANISLSDKEFKWVDNEEDLKLVSIQLSKVSRLSLQLHQHQFHSYQGFTCLMSISTNSSDYIIDAIKLRSKLNVLLNVFTNPKIIKIMINSQQSLLALQRDFGLYVINLFDISEAIKLFGDKELQNQNEKLSLIVKKFLDFGENSDKKVNKFKRSNEKNEITNLMFKEFEEEENEIKEIEKLKELQFYDQNCDYHYNNNNNNNKNNNFKNFEHIDWRIRPIPFKSLRYLRHHSYYLYNIFEFLKSSLSKHAIHQYSQNNKKLPRNTNKLKQKLIKQVFERGKEICLKGYRKPKFYSKNFLKLYNNYCFNKNENYNNNNNKNINDITNNNNNNSIILNNTNTTTTNNNNNNNNEYNKFNSLQLYIFSELYNWRDNIARKEDECIYSILSNKNLFLLCKKLPTTEQSLLSLFPKTKPPIFIKKYSKNLIKILLIKFQDNEIQKRFDNLIEKADLILNNNKDGKNENKKLNNTIKGKEQQEERGKGKEKEKEKESEKKKEKEREREMEKEKGVDDIKINTTTTELQKIFPKIDSSVIFEISDSEASDSNSEDIRGSSPFCIYSQNNSKGYNSNDLFNEENFKMSGKITPPEQFAPKTQKEIYELSKRNRKRNKENKKKRAQTLIPNPSPLDLLKLNVNDELKSESISNSENEGNNEKDKYSFNNSLKRKNQKKNLKNEFNNKNNININNNTNIINNTRKRKETIGNNIENTMKFMRTIGWVNEEMEHKLFIYKNQNYNYSHNHAHSHIHNHTISNNRSKNINQSNNNNNNNNNNNMNNNQNNNQNNFNNNNNNNMNINSKQLWNSRIETNFNNTNKNKKKNRQRNTNKNWNNDDQYNYFNKNYSHRGSKIHKPAPTRNQFTQDFNNSTNNVSRRNDNISSRNFSSNSFSRYDGKTWNTRGRNIHSNRGKSNRNNNNNYDFHD
ncbi:polymyositis/scleroderma autoantigen-related [Anaeramoeba flamelloides]|uniref:Polymyositis/scleroderma autoantigen-related n=1 Tax=Anaeramoeba flamelloides TaxID=1746091 RepID=A0AAV7Y7K2_9EUKA|nr:polymyositis/scleroderma autoantigen-related [Anaeramoeba flamelloides]